MSPQQGQNGSNFDTWAHSLLRELESQTPEEIRRQRSSERAALKLAVAVAPGNASQSREGSIDGVTGDISAGGCGLMTDIPLRVGDLYRLTFEKTELDLPTVFARCVRCRLVREDAFESGFSFFTKLELAAAEAAPSQSGLLA
ncbi:MAG: PilZ domain-containing protein [Planctomycetota bacterium]